MPTPWALTPLKSTFATAIQPLGGAAPSTSLQNAYRPPTTSYAIAPITRSSPTYSTGMNFSQPQASSTSRSSALGTLGSLGSGGNTQPASTRTPYSSPTSGSAGTSTASTAAPRSGALTQPGAYENWYAQNASRYNQPTALSSYWQSVQGRIGGQRFQPTAARGAYDQMQSAYSQPGQGMTNAYDIAGQLRNQTQGEGVMNSATSYFSGPNNMAQYYGDNQDFFGQSGDIENYYDTNGQRFQQAGFGEQNAQNILGSEDLTGLYDNRLVGDELNYFRQPLREKSYSEQLYESGNQGLNQWYDLQRSRQQEDLENQMSAMGVFGSGETAEAMYRMREGLAAEQARDMAGLAAQGDLERRSRADLLSGMAGAAADEEIARGGLMLEGANTGLQLDRDAISRLTQGGQLANMSSRYALDRVTEGGNQAYNADQSLFAQGTGLGNLGNMMSQQEINRLNTSAQTGMSADIEQSNRLRDLYQSGLGVDNLGLQAQAADLSWIQAGGNMAGAVDVGNLAQLNAGGGAAQTAQDMYEQRRRSGFQDPFAAANALAGHNAVGTNTATTEQAQIRSEAVNLLAQRENITVQAAERQVQEWADAGQLLTLYASLKGQR